MDSVGGKAPSSPFVSGVVVLFLSARGSSAWATWSSCCQRALLSAGVTPLLPSPWCSCLHSQGHPREDPDASLCSLYLLCGTCFQSSWGPHGFGSEHPVPCSLAEWRREREKQRSQGCMSAVGLGASMPPFPPRRKHGGCFEFRHNTLNNLLLCCHLLTTPLAGHNQWRERKLWCHKSWVTLPNGISKNMSS